MLNTAAMLVNATLAAVTVTANEDLTRVSCLMVSISKYAGGMSPTKSLLDTLSPTRFGMSAMDKGSKPDNELPASMLRSSVSTWLLAGADCAGVGCR